MSFLNTTSLILVPKNQWLYKIIGSPPALNGHASTAIVSPLALHPPYTCNPQHQVVYPGPRRMVGRNHPSSSSRQMALRVAAGFAPRNVDYLYRIGRVRFVGFFLTSLLSLLIGIAQEVFGILDK